MPPCVEITGHQEPHAHFTARAGRDGSVAPLDSAREKPELQANLRHERREAEDEGRGAEVRGERDGRARPDFRVRIGQRNLRLREERHDGRRHPQHDQRNPAVDAPSRHLDLGPESRLIAGAEVARDHAPAAKARAERIARQDIVERIRELAAARGRIQADRILGEQRERALGDTFPSEAQRERKGADDHRAGRRAEDERPLLALLEREQDGIGREHEREDDQRHAHLTQVSRRRAGA